MRNCLYHLLYTASVVICISYYGYAIFFFLNVMYTELIISLTACENKIVSGAENCGLYKVSTFLITIA